jgi:hypothetical protein
MVLAGVLAGVGIGWNCKTARQNGETQRARGGDETDKKRDKKCQVISASPNQQTNGRKKAQKAQKNQTIKPCYPQILQITTDSNSAGFYLCKSVKSVDEKNEPPERTPLAGTDKSARLYSVRNGETQRARGGDETDKKCQVIFVAFFESFVPFCGHPFSLPEA